MLLPPSITLLVPYFVINILYKLYNMSYYAKIYEEKKKIHLRPNDASGIIWTHFHCSPISCLFIHWLCCSTVAACGHLLELAIASGGRGRGARRKPWNQLANQHGSCDLLRVGLNDLTNIKFFKSFEPTLNRSHDYVLFALVVSILCILYKNKRWKIN